MVGCYGDDDRMRFKFLALIFGLALDVIYPQVVAADAQCEAGSPCVFVAGASSSVDENEQGGKEKIRRPNSREVFRDRIFAIRTAEELQRAMTDMENSNISQETDVWKEYIEGRLEGEVSLGMYNILTYDVSARLAHLAENGDENALKYLEKGAHLQYWQSRRPRWFYPDGDLDRTFTDLRNRFILRLSQLADSSTRQEDFEEIFGFLQNLYRIESSIEDGHMPPEDLVNAFADGLIRREAGVGKKVTADAKVKVYLSDEYPHAQRCVSTFYGDHEGAMQAAKIYRDILENPSRKGDWALSVRGLAATRSLTAVEDFDYLVKFLENRFAGEVDAETFAAIAEVPIALGIIAHPPYESTMAYMQNAIQPNYWSKGRVRWTFRELQGQERDLYLAQLFLKVLPLSYYTDQRAIPETVLQGIKYRDERERKLFEKVFVKAQKRIEPGSTYMCYYFGNQRKNPTDLWNYPY